MVVAVSAVVLVFPFSQIFLVGGPASTTVGLFSDLIWSATGSAILAQISWGVPQNPLLAELPHPPSGRPLEAPQYPLPLGAPHPPSGQSQGPSLPNGSSSGVTPSIYYSQGRLTHILGGHGCHNFLLTSCRGTQHPLLPGCLTRVSGGHRCQHLLATFPRGCTSIHCRHFISVSSASWRPRGVLSSP
jgi:hypothetical protein